MSNNFSEPMERIRANLRAAQNDAAQGDFEGARWKLSLIRVLLGDASKALYAESLRRAELERSGK